MNIDEILDMPHVREREMCIEIEDPVAGKVKTIGQPIKFSRTPCIVKESAPQLGQHTREVLEELGYSGERIRKRAEDGIIKVA